MDNYLSNEKGSKIDEYFQSIPSEIQSKINIQMRNSLCEIEYNDSKIGNGFLCKIPYPNFSKLLPVLIINTNIINEIKFLNDIKILFDKNKKIRYIKNIKERKIYINKEYEILIIQIFPKEDDLNIFLEIDENIFNSINYKDKYISILNNSNELLYDNINNIIENRIEYKSWKKDEIIDGPIILLDNIKVIGINKRLNNNNNNRLLYVPDQPPPQTPPPFGCTPRGEAAAPFGGQ